mmetsp:Transcript_34727/g.81077  ORF Transcript_34727/g.81077 Transcript_34727/m.81077 type:complete len:273 (-) Transcript_34727:57-875(-)
MRRENFKRLFKQKSLPNIDGNGTVIPLEVDGSGEFPAPGDNSPAIQRSTSSGLHLSRQRTRQAAGKAGKVVASGATKVATAFKRRLRRRHSSEETEALAPDIVGAVEEAFESSSDDTEEDVSELSDTDQGENASGVGEPLSASETKALPRNDAPAEAGKSQSQGQADSVDKASKKPEWDSTKFRNVRPLQLGSIWDIPTSREPNPEPRSKHAAGATDAKPRTEAKSSKHGLGGKRAKDGPEIVSFGGGAPPPPRLVSCKWLRRLVRCLFHPT